MSSNISFLKSEPLALSQLSARRQAVDQRKKHESSKRLSERVDKLHARKATDARSELCAVPGQSISKLKNSERVLF